MHWSHRSDPEDFLPDPIPREAAWHESRKPHLRARFPNRLSLDLPRYVCRTPSTMPRCHWPAAMFWTTYIHRGTYEAVLPTDPPHTRAAPEHLQAVSLVPSYNVRGDAWVPASASKAWPLGLFSPLGHQSAVVGFGRELANVGRTSTI